MAAYCYLTNRMTSLPLTIDRRETEWQKILAIAENNKFPIHLITRLKRHTQHKTDNKNKNGPPSHTTATKSEKSPTSLNRQISR
jgi:hypothetical protein